MPATASLSRRLILVFLILVSLFSEFNYASIGDDSPEFRLCLHQCTRDTCIGDIPKTPLPLTLRLTFWTCPADCSYQCQHEVTQRRLERGESVVQFYGKWPFYRFLGMQEPASVLFSVLNGYGHWSHRKAVYALPHDHPYRWLLIGYMWLGINVWVWSSVFHTRDLDWTEKADYFSAALGILYMFGLAICRVGWILDGKQQRRIMLALVPFYLMHVGYLGLIRFDYGYNMLASVSVAMLHNILWVYWSIKSKKRRSDWWVPTMLVLAVTGAAMLELFDFPPWGYILDAHSLWHAATAPMVFVWYRFFLHDADIVYKATRVERGLPSSASKHKLKD